MNLLNPVNPRVRLPLTALLLAGTFLAIYLPDAGHGFTKDDFSWIRNTAFHHGSDFLGVFQRNVGFYRPLVSASFAADFVVWGLNPFGYAVTNLLLCAADAIFLFALVRRFSLPAGAALVGAAVWAFNFHGINMSLLWLSGRTALLVSLFALATVHAVLAGHRLAAGVLCLCALLCKEEAVMLPPILAAFVALEESLSSGRSVVRKVVRTTWPLWVSLIAYVALRANSGAFGPLDAPSYYRFSFSPPLILRNIAEYADRAGTTAFVVAVVLFAALARKPPPLLDDERSSLRFAVLWVIGMYSLTVFLPVRSSLYAVLPSLGTALAAGVSASVVLRARPDRFQRVALALVILLVALIPVYRVRNVRWVETAETSARVLRDLQAAAGSGQAGGRIAVVDDPEERFNLEAAFGPAFPDAVTLVLGPRWNGVIVGSVEAAADAELVFCYRDRGLVAATGDRCL